MIITSCPGVSHGGVWRHLTELTNSTGLTTHIQTEKLLERIPGNTELIIFGGCWTPDYAKVAQLARSFKVKVAHLHCSPFGQTDICNEQYALSSVIDLINFDKIDYLLTGDKLMSDAFKKCLDPEIKDRIKFLPQTMDVSKFNLLKTNKSAIGLFCGNMPNKNLMNQVVAAKLTGKKLLTNAFDRRCEEFANMLNLQYDSFGWMTDKDYKDTLKKCGVGLQVSWSESFDYVAAELSLLGIPTVTSKTIYWNLNELQVKNPDDPFEIASVINKAFNKNLGERTRKNILEELDKRSKIANNTLLQMVGG